MQILNLASRGPNPSAGYWGWVLTRSGPRLPRSESGYAGRTSRRHSLISSPLGISNAITCQSEASTPPVQLARLTVSSTSVTVMTPGADCSTTSKVTVSTIGRAAFFAEARLGLALGIARFGAAFARAALASFLALGRAFAALFFWTFDESLLRLAMVDPPRWRAANALMQSYNKTTCSESRQPTLRVINRRCQLGHQRSWLVLQQVRRDRFDARHKRNEWIFWIAVLRACCVFRRISSQLAAAEAHHVSIRRLREHAALQKARPQV